MGILIALEESWSGYVDRINVKGSYSVIGKWIYIYVR